VKPASGSAGRAATPAQPAGARAVPLGQAVVLGLLHGPAELAPISSSGHTALAPWLFGWRYEELDPAVRKRFEVALHAGVIVALRRDVLHSLSGLRGARLGLILGASVPPALAGVVFERVVERRLGTPRSVAVGLLGGSVGMVVGELVGVGERRAADASLGDGLVLGAAQAMALVPGVSRSGAALVAARVLGFARADGESLAFEVGVPVMVGAVVLKARELGRIEHGEWESLAVGAAASFVSTTVSAALLRRRSSLLPYAAYRSALAGAVLRRLRQNGRG
jgi:undecaprenyl-diphosphatase